MMKPRCAFLLLAVTALTAQLVPAAQDPGHPVSFEKGILEIPTYTFGRSLDVPPLFQSGNSKGVYPYAALDRDSLSLQPVPVKYFSLTLENQYLRLVVLPELGGRIWSLWDKVGQRDVFYNPGVIKPSAYNHRGGWPVGNLEVYGPFDAHMLTWPGEAWPWAVKQQRDGSITLILSHIEHFFRNKVFMELTLRPGRACLELGIRLHNGNQVPNRYLLWTNAGVPATEGTRFVYPMTKTIGHDTAEFGSWPVFEGVDLSWYRNNKTMLGVFGLDLYDDFIAAYDYLQDFGTVRYADRRLARGAKTWTWGVGRAGLRHTESYTDNGIPYIEVQSGRFVWDGNYEFVDPGKTDGWTEFWYAVGGLGGLTTATRDVAVNLDFPRQGTAHWRLTATRDIGSAELRWKVGESKWRTQQTSLKVGLVSVVEDEVGNGGAGEPLTFRIASNGEQLIDYTYYPGGVPPDRGFASDSIPRKFAAVEELTSEELYAKGLTHEKLGQIAEAEAAYREALRRDPLYTAPRLQLGLLALSRFEYDSAEEHFSKMLARDPSNSEAHYFLAVLHMRVGRNAEARGHLFRLLPSSGVFDQRDLQLGVLATRERAWVEAESLLSSAARANPLQPAAGQGYAYVLRKLGKRAEAESECRRLLDLDPTNAFARAELAFLLDWQGNAVEGLNQATASHEQSFLELATEYMALGAWSEVIGVLDYALELSRRNGGHANPLLQYYRAFALHQKGMAGEAGQALREAAAGPIQMPIYPFRWETRQVLAWVVDTAPEDGNAPSLLADLLYARSHREEAVSLWRKSVELAPEHFVSLRNLGWALSDEGSSSEALPFLERAAEVRPGNLEIVSGLSQLYTRLQRSEDALRVVGNALQSNPQDDTLLQLLATVRACSGDFDGALETVTSHHFRPRHQSYALLNLYRAARLLKSYELAKAGSFDEAQEQIALGLNAPSNLGVDDFAALRSGRLLYFQALLYRAAGDRARERAAWEAAAGTSDTDFNGEGLFRALAMQESGEAAAAQEWLAEFERVNRLRKEDAAVRERVDAFYLSGIFSISRGDEAGARRDFEKALSLDESSLFVRHAILFLEAGLL